MKKRFIGFLVLASFLLMFNTASYASGTDENTEKSTAELLESVMDEFGLFSFQIGRTEPTITIGMDQTRSESKLREYLDDNLSEEAKKKYEIYIFKEDIDKLKQEHQKSLQE
ncbi:hypothetical protein [Bacillus cabrialesii]|uniref:hypothetical protein n=1 Tax=Bacillus cabrialesii TaxID=2487276 RepID=UPI001C05B25E|nr:hypothetical protein [Bacillus cabrialesii]MBU2661815.1 hypothetical protein [Bacillus cabrialesii]